MDRRKIIQSEKEWKVLPILALRNFGPIRESSPTALATSLTDAPVDSQIAEIVLILDIR